MSSHIDNARPQPDQVLVDIADYVLNYEIRSEEAYDTAGEDSKNKSAPLQRGVDTEICYLRQQEGDTGRDD